jgi:hypothetical protein
MDEERPISEGKLLWAVKPFKEHANNQLGQDTPIKEALRSIPGIKHVVGAFTPAQMSRDNPVAMIGIEKAIFEEIETGRMRIATLAWYKDAEEILGFKNVRGKWRATSVTPSPLADKKKPYYRTIYDITEHPDHFLPTLEQAEVIEIIQNMFDRNLRDAQRAGVNAVELLDDYWHRVVLSGPKATAPWWAFGTMVKNYLSKVVRKEAFTKHRRFEFVDDGASQGFKYETHPLTLAQDRLGSGIRAIAEQTTRRAVAGLPGVKTPLELFERKYPQALAGQGAAREARDAARKVYLANKTNENFIALRQAEAEYVTAMTTVFDRKLEARTPGYGELRLPSGRIAPSELIEDIRKFIDLPEFSTGVGRFSNGMLEVTRLVRTTLTNVDLAAGFIQGQVLFYRNNPAWWVAQAQALTSMVSDPYAYVNKNFALLDEGIRVGAISIPTEFLFATTGISSIPTRVPVAGAVMKSFNRAFEWFILVGQAEHYKTTRKGVLKRSLQTKQRELPPVVRGGRVIESPGEIFSPQAIPEPGAELPTEALEALTSLGAAIRNEVGTESYAILGVRPTQRTIEQLAFFAARFFRAHLGTLTRASTGTAQMLTLGKPSPGEAESMKALASLIIGGLSLTIGVMWLKERRLPNLTDPFAPDWLSVPIGRTYFNFFGPFYPYFRTLARMSVYFLQGKPSKAADELKRFLQSKAGIPYRVIDIMGQFQYAGKAQTFDGEVLEKTPGGIAQGLIGEMMVPISIQEALQAVPEGRYWAAIGEIFGLVGRGSPYAQMDIEFRKQTGLNPEGLGYRFAERWQIDAMEEKFPKIADMILRRGRGVYGEAARLWEEIDIKHYAEEIALAEDFLERERAGSHTPDTLAEFREGYREIQKSRADWKAGVNLSQGLFQEKKPLPTDPNERALAQYFHMWDDVMTGSDQITEEGWKKLAAWQVFYDGKWTSEQKAFVERNTGSGDHPELIKEYREAVKILADYWDKSKENKALTRRRDAPKDAALRRWYGY